MLRILLIARSYRHMGAGYIAESRKNQALAWAEFGTDFGTHSRAIVSVCAALPHMPSAIRRAPVSQSVRR
jgi:hypothetical protein